MGKSRSFYTVQMGDGVNDVATGLSNAINADTDITALGISANAVTDTVFINQPATTYSVSASGGATEWIWLGNNNDGNLVAEIDGTITASDTLTLTVNDPRLGGGTEPVTYTVQPGDTNITVANGVAALINGDTNLTNIGVTAVTSASAKLNWSEAFTANQLLPGWNQTEVSATDAVPNTTTVPYGVYTVAPNGSTPSYDMNGNMTGDGTNTYLWDAENRLIEIDYPGVGNNSVFTYDGLGRCVKIVETVSSSITSTKQFIWCDNQMCEARDAGSAVTAQYFKNGETIGGTSYYYNRDHLGSVREVADSSGNILSQYNYTPYGQAMKFSETVPSDFQYAGYYYHAPSGLYLTRTRSYAANFSRWISRDSIQEKGGFNLFAYVLNNPVRFVDPNGTDIWIEGPSKGEPCGHESICVGDPNGDYDSISFGFKNYVPQVYYDDDKGGPILEYKKTTSAEDDDFIRQLPDLGTKDWYGPFNSCRNFSEDEFKKSSRCGYAAATEKSSSVEPPSLFMVFAKCLLALR